MVHTHIVKRQKHQEPYDNHKVYASCYAACLNTNIPKKKAENICQGVTKEIDRWISKKDMVHSEEIFKEITKAMAKNNKEASFMYKTHRDIS